MTDDRYEPWVRMEDGSDIAGWYSFQGFHEKAVRTAPPGATLVEVGVFCGLSLIGLAKLAKAADKGLRVVGVDTFAGSAEHGSLTADLPNGAMAREAWNNLDRAGVREDVVLIVGDSARVAEMFKSRSVHAVFLDGDHSEEGVTRDLEAWGWKVETGGWIGGDDVWTFPGVRAAVRAVFPWLVVPPEQCWWEVQLKADRGFLL